MGPLYRAPRHASAKKQLLAAEKPRPMLTSALIIQSYWAKLSKPSRLGRLLRWTSQSAVPISQLWGWIRGKRVNIDLVRGVSPPPRQSRSFWF